MRGKEGGGGQAHTPHRSQIHDGWAQGIACAHTDTVGDDGGGKEGFGKSFDTEHLGSQLPNLGHGRQQSYHLRCKNIHQHTHQGHHGHAQSHRHVGETAAQVATLGTIGLANQRRGCIANAIARHIAQALGRDGKRVGSDGHITQRRHDEGTHHLCPTHEHRLHSDGQTDTQRVVHIVPHPPKRHTVLPQRQYPVAASGYPRHGKRGNQIGTGRPYGRTYHAHVQQIDKKIVESHVEHTHRDTHGARHTHVARTLEHGGRQMKQQQKRKRQREHPEVSRCVGSNIRSATQPIRQPRADGHPHTGEHHAHRQSAYQRMAKHVAGLREIVGSHKVGHLHRESGRGRREDAAHEPQCRLHQSDTGRGGRTQVSHHRGIDEEHEHHRNLRQHRRHAQFHNQVELLARGHLLAHAYLLQ